MPPPRGLSLAGLDALAEDAGGHVAIAEWTTSKLKDFVVSATKLNSIAYADELSSRSEGASFVGPANAFLSHSYRYKFVDVLDAVRAWQMRQAEKGLEGPWFYYFDLAVVNQHGQKGTVGFEVLRSEFGDSVAACGRTLLVLRWADSSELATSRAWCIFEVATSLEKLKPEDVHIILPPADSSLFCHGLANDFPSVEKRLCTIDAADADALVQDDLDNIRRMIEEKFGGYGEVNEKVLRMLREYILVEAREALKRRGADGVSDMLAVSIGDFLRSMGRTKDGEAHLRGVLAQREALLAAEPTSERLLLSVARALSSLGSTVRLADGDAIGILQRALDIQTEHLSPDDEDVLTTTGRLGVVLKDAGKLDQALPLYTRTYEGRRSRLGDDHVDTIFSHMNLAMLFSLLNRHSEHDAIVLDVVERRSRVLGKRNHQTLFARHRHGRALRNAGMLLMAEAEMKDVCELQSAVCGKAHKETLSSRSLLAHIWLDLNRWRDARCELEDVQKELLRKFPLHFDTIRATSDLAVLLFQVVPPDFVSGLTMHELAVDGIFKNVAKVPSNNINRFLSLLKRAEQAAKQLVDGAPDPELRARATKLLAMSSSAVSATSAH